MVIENTENNMTGTDELIGYFYVGKDKNFCLQAEWTGTAEGDFALYVSGKYPKGSNVNGETPEWADTDWIALPNSVHSVTGSDGNHIWDISNASYFWVKVVYTNTAGEGTLSVIGASK